MVVVWIILAIVVLLVILAISIYNRLIKLRQKVRNLWSQIDVQLQRRFNLIPNLLESVKGYMEHEKDVFIKVAEIRTAFTNAKSIHEKAKIDNQLSDALKDLLAIAENYQELKANQNFFELQQELKNTENKISFSRQFYNNDATIYNTKLAVFPSNIIGLMFGFKFEELFKVENDDIRKNVKIDFNK